jgi:putative ABC transport system ATP-binding protein
VTNAAPTTSEDLGRPASGRLAARADAITKAYGGGDARVTALDEVTVGIPRGGFTAVMGPSGSGKSTLMHCMAGLDTVDAGRVLVGDVDLTRLDERQLTRLRRDRVGFVFQASNLVPMLTALENITLPIDIAGRKPDRDWLDTVIDTVGLRSRLRHRPSELSGGQQQRAAFARALAGRPEIVFADEPTGNLDSRSGAELLSFLRSSVREMGQTVVMVTHDPVAAAYADEVLFLRDGRVVGRLPDPTAERVLERMKGLELPGAEGGAAR